MRPHPLKINLFLAVEKLRSDGYHNLFSLGLLLKGNDRIHLKIDPSLTDDHLEIAIQHNTVSDQKLLTDKNNNTILKAVRAFRNHHPFQGYCTINLIKNTPIQAGLGGGSSNAACTLVKLNRMLGSPLSLPQMLDIGKSIGADVPLFIQNAPALMAGIGEVLSVPPSELLQALKDTTCLIFKPNFGISTPEAYAFLKATRSYTPITDRKAFLEATLYTLKNHGVFLNDFLRFTEVKYPIIPTFLKYLSSTYELPIGMSGSGSACFMILHKNHQQKALPMIIKDIKSAFGSSAFYQLCDWILPQKD